MAAFDKSDLMLFGILMLVLFVIAVITVLTYIGLDEMKAVACKQILTTNTWDGTNCVNASITGPLNGSGNGIVTVTTIDKIDIVEAAVDIALSLLGLVVLIAVFAVVIKIAVAFKDVF